MLIIQEKMFGNVDSVTVTTALVASTSFNETSSYSMQTNQVLRNIVSYQKDRSRISCLNKQSNHVPEAKHEITPDQQLDTLRTCSFSYSSSHAVKTSNAAIMTFSNSSYEICIKRCVPRTCIITRLRK